VVFWNNVKPLQEIYQIITKYAVNSNCFTFKEYSFYRFAPAFQLVEIGNLEKTRKICLSIDVFELYDYC